MSKTILCIGGPKDGERVTIDDGRSSFSYSTRDGDHFTEFVYEIIALRDHDGIHEAAVPAGQRGILKQLLDGYSPKNTTAADSKEVVVVIADTFDQGRLYADRLSLQRPLIVSLSSGSGEHKLFGLHAPIVHLCGPCKELSHDHDMLLKRIQARVERHHAVP